MATEGKVITCRAAVAWKVNEPFAIETVEINPPTSNEIRIKMTSAGICHTDIFFQQDKSNMYPFPSILGHEGAGIVESVGPDVTSIVPGDAVILLCQPYCGKCKKCESSKTNACSISSKDRMKSYRPASIKCKGQPLTQMLNISAFSEYTITSEPYVTKINPKAPLNKIAVVGCCIPTGYGAAVKAAKVEPGSTCVIWGLGGVGLSAVMGCRDNMASKIIGVDINSGKFGIAKELGCTHVINPKDPSQNVVDVIREWTDGGADYCFVSVGIVDVMEQAFSATHPDWGETIIIGCTDIGVKMSVGVWELLFGKKVRGIALGCYKAKLDIPHLVEKVMDGVINIDKLITHVISLDDINHGIDLLEAGESIRTIIDFNIKK